jgi:hypothetical protein
MPRAKTRKLSYGVHPSVVMVQSWMLSLREKTGRTLDEWIELVCREGPPSEMERRDWLKTRHQLGTNTAWWIAGRSLGVGVEDGDPAAYLVAAEGYVELMFAGKRSRLRPLYNKLLTLGLSMGDDAKACPCKSIVPLYRHHVFAQIKPASSTRIDLGLALQDTAPTRRLIDTGGLEKRDRITHRIEITTPSEIDAEVEMWLRRAYDLDA